MTQNDYELQKRVIVAKYRDELHTILEWQTQVKADIAEKKKQRAQLDKELRQLEMTRQDVCKRRYDVETKRAQELKDFAAKHDAGRLKSELSDYPMGSIMRELFRRGFEGTITYKDGQQLVIGRQERAQGLTPDE